MTDIVATSPLVQRLADLATRGLVLVHDTPMTGPDLEALVRAYARWLGHAHTLAPGDRVAFVADPTPLAIAALIAHLRLGLVHVPVPPRYTPDEVAHLVTDCGAVLVRPEHVLLDPGPFDWPAPPPADALAWLVYTSGTTGRPKGVMMEHGALAANLSAITTLWEVGTADRVIVALPLFHVHGLGLATLGSLLQGAAIILISKFSPEGIVRAFRDLGATVFMGVPTMYHLLLEHLAVHPGDAAALARARLFTAGSAPLPSAAFRAFESLTGHAILERYGMTETGFTLSNPYRGERRPGAVGQPVPGLEVRLVDDEGQPVEPGAPGEIEVRGPIMRGYWGRPDATREVYREGWFRTGDTAVFADGHVTIVGRTSTDIIKTGGFKVGAREVEDVVLGSGLVRECAVFGLPDPKWGEVVAAAVVGLDPDEVAALGEHCESHLADYKRPRRWFPVDALPRNALGKVQKAALRQSLGSRASSPAIADAGPRE